MHYIKILFTGIKEWKTLQKRRDFVKSDYTYNMFTFVKAAVYPGHYEMSWECFQLQIKRIDCSPSTKPTCTTKEQNLQY